MNNHLAGSLRGRVGGSATSEPGPAAWRPTPAAPESRAEPGRKPLLLSLRSMAAPCHPLWAMSRCPGMLGAVPPASRGPAAAMLLRGAGQSCSEGEQEVPEQPRALGWWVGPSWAQHRGCLLLSACPWVVCTLLGPPALQGACNPLFTSTAAACMGVNCRSWQGTN